MARISCGVVCLLFGLGGSALSQTVAPVKVIPADIQPIAEVVEGHGVIEPVPQGDVDIATATAARIEEILVKPGDAVQKDRLLVRLQRDRSTDMAVEKARISLEQARLDLDRSQRLFDSGIIPRIQLEQTQTAYKLAEADCELQTRSLKYAVSNSEIRAPIQGLVSSINGVVGQIADPSQEILRLVNTGEMAARIGVEIEDLAKIRQGQPARIAIPNLPGDESFRGEVVKFNREVDPATQLIHIWVHLDNQEGLLLPGMFAEAQVAVKTAPQALVVPRAAVLRDEEGAYVFVVEGGTAHKLPVKTGIQTEAMVQILEGVQRGQSVVCEGNYELEDNMPVDIQPGE